MYIWKYHRAGSGSVGVCSVPSYFDMICRVVYVGRLKYSSRLSDYLTYAWHDVILVHWLGVIFYLSPYGVVFT